jgi:hypothetical protein
MGEATNKMNRDGDPNRVVEKRKQISRKPAQLSHEQAAESAHSFLSNWRNSVDAALNLSNRLRERQSWLAERQSD